MAISASPVQTCDSGASALLASGASFGFASNVTAGNSLVLCIVTISANSGDISTVTGCGGTWHKGTAHSGAPNLDQEIWYCVGATGGSKAITVTSTSSSSYAAQCSEWSGVGSFVSAATGSGTSTSASLTLSPGVTGDLCVVALQGGGWTVSPSSPWADYNAGRFVSAHGADVAWQVTASSSAVTATWTQPSGAWETVGIIMSPAPGFIQGTTVAVTAAQTTLTPALTGIAGRSLLVLCLTTSATSGQGASTVSGAGATWTIGPTIAAANGNVEIWIGQILTAGCRLDEWSGLDTTESAIDLTATTSGTSATITTPASAFTTTEANELIYHFSLATSAETASPGGSWTTEAGPLTTAVQRNGIAYQVVAASGTVVGTTSWTQTLGFYEVASVLLEAFGIHSYPQTLTAALTFTGSITKNTARALPASLTFAGTITKTTSRALTAALTFAGSLIKSMLVPLAAALTFAGTFTKKSIGAALSASLTLAGNLNKAVTRLLSGSSLTLTGALTKQTRIPLTGALTFVGSMGPKAIGAALSASLTFAGSLTKQTSRNLAAALTFAGSLIKQAQRSFTGALIFTGSLTKQTAYALASALTFVGNLVSSSAGQFFQTLTASLTFAGNLAKQTQTPLSSALTFTGSIAKQTVRGLSAALTFTGSLAKQTGMVLSAALTFAGSLTKRTAHTLASSSLTFAGSMSRQAQKSLAGVLTFSTTMGRGISHVLFTSLVFTGSLAKRTARAIASAVTLSGTLIAKRIANVIYKLLPGIVKPGSKFGRSSPSSKSGVVNPKEQGGRT